MAEHRAKSKIERNILKYMSAGGVTTTWETIVYPESAPIGWVDNLRETRIPFAISPLHDRDTWTDQDYKKDPSHIPGTYKKPHYHVVWYYPNTKTQKSAQEFSNLASGVLAIPCHSPKGSYEYFWHQNDADKEQYDKRLVRHYNGFDPDKFIEMTKEQEKLLCRNIQLFISHEKIDSYRVLCDMLIFDDDHWDWYKYVSSHTMHYNAYFKASKVKDKTSKENESN